jgi:acyl carrier protein
MVTKKMPLDFFCAFSSLTSVIGNKGQSDYAYANRYMDEFINLRCSQVENGLRSGHSCVINWPLWENGGMNLNETQKNKISSEYRIEVIQETQGLHVLEKILDSDYSHILPIHGNIGKVCEILQEMDIYLPKDKDVECNKLILDSRQILKPNQIQEQLLVMFSQTLKIDSSEIDVEEDLDTYGFDSLMMVEILRKLEDMYGLSMDPSIINQSKNIKKLGYYLFEKMDSSSFCESIQEKDEINNNYTDFNRNISSNNRDIAVIGMACRFPKANDLNEY